MILEIICATLLAYIAVGIAICSSKPAVLKRRQALFGTAMMFSSPQGRLRRMRLIVFHVTMILGIVFLWPVFLFDERRQSKAQERRVKEYEKAHPYIGLTFGCLGGDRLLLCSDCDQTFMVRTGGHYISAHRHGYQCQTCGKCDTRYYEEPFAKYRNFDRTDQIDDVPAKYRADKIEDVLSKADLIERQMQKFPREEWFKNWEPDLARYREEISRVPPEELASVKKICNDVNAAYDASLFCECGGPLDRDQVLFCPACRSKNLECLAHLEVQVYEKHPVLGLLPMIDGDKLHHKGARYRIAVKPLENYLQQYRPEIEFSWNDTSSSRGYTGTWEVKDSKLHLTHLAEFSRRDKEHHPSTGPDVLRSLFPAAGEDGLFADRFSGVVRCPYGEQLHFVHPGFASTYPHELVLSIENGVLVSEEVKDSVIPPEGYLTLYRGAL